MNDYMEKDIRTTFKNTIFYGIWKFRPFSSVIRSSGEKGGNFKVRKNRVLESYFNIFFTVDKSE